MSEEPGGELRSKIVNFVFGTVLAGLVTATFTYKSWREQTRLDLAKERLHEATAAFDKTSLLMSGRIFRSFDVVRHIGDKDDSFAKRRERLDAAVDDWNLSYPDALQRFQFSLEIDQHGDNRKFPAVEREQFDTLDCGRKFAEGNFPAHGDPASPSWLLAAFNHCVITSPIGTKADELTKLSANADRYDKITRMDKAVDDLAAHADNVRIAAKKAIHRLREGTEAHGFAAFLTNW